MYKEVLEVERSFLIDDRRLYVLTKEGRLFLFEIPNKDPSVYQIDHFRHVFKLTTESIAELGMFKRQSTVLRMVIIAEGEWWLSTPVNELTKIPDELLECLI